MRYLAIVIVLIGSAVMAADQLAEKWQKRIDGAEDAYQAAVKKADDARFFAVQKASGDRVLLLKKILSDATKAGDFDAASALKEKTLSAEKQGGSLARPASRAKFGGHEYALIPTSLTWHLAQRHCEQLGGHLVCINSLEEEQFIKRLCVKVGVWIGASDEETEGKWVNVDGSRPVLSKISADNDLGREHSLSLGANGEFGDALSGGRLPFVCEWGK